MREVDVGAPGRGLLERAPTLWEVEGGSHLGGGPPAGCRGDVGTCGPQAGGPGGRDPAAGGAERPWGGGRRQRRQQDPGGGRAGSRGWTPEQRRRGGVASQQRRDGEGLAGPGGGQRGRGRHGGVCSEPCRPPLYGRPDRPPRDSCPSPGDRGGRRGWGGMGRAGTDGIALGPARWGGGAEVPCPLPVPPALDGDVSPHVPLPSTGVSPTMFPCLRPWR